MKLGCKFCRRCRNLRRTKTCYSLRYVKSAKASTDVPTSVSVLAVFRNNDLAEDLFQIPEFISQRRRWLNGSLFAAIHATVFFGRIWTSGHNFFRKIVLQVDVPCELASAYTHVDPQIEFIYNAIQLLFSWTSLANFYLAFFFVSTSTLSLHGLLTSLLAGLFCNVYSQDRCVQLSEQRRRNGGL